MFISAVFTRLIIFTKYNTIRLRASFDDLHQSSYSTKNMSQKRSKSALDWRLAQPPAVLYLEPWQLELFIQSRSSSSCLTVCAGEVELIRSPGVSLSPVALLCSSLCHSTHVASVFSLKLGDTPSAHQPTTALPCQNWYKVSSVGPRFHKIISFFSIDFSCNLICFIVSTINSDVYHLYAWIRVKMYYSWV